MPFSLMHAVILFVAYAVVDALYVYYTNALTKYHPFLAANTGIAIHLILAFGVVSYTDNIYYLIPLIAGSWIGTFFVVRLEKKREHRRQNHGAGSSVVHDPKRWEA